jgi:hypothetical protein
MSVPAGEKTLIDAATGVPFPAVPAQTLLGSSRTLGWRGILVEWHRLPPDELPPHYVIGHGISVLIPHPQQRRHSTLGHISPAEYERRAVSQAA